jgi:hypothetical protein
LPLEAELLTGLQTEGDDAYAVESIFVSGES